MAFVKIIHFFSLSPFWGRPVIFIWFVLIQLLIHNFKTRRSVAV